MPESTTGTPRMAGGPMITATVQNIAQTSKLLRMETAEHEMIELRAPAGLLSQLQIGGRVEVVIHKQERPGCPYQHHRAGNRAGSGP